MNTSCNCSNCSNLQVLLNEKESEIERLKSQIQYLKDLLLDYQKKSCRTCFCKTEIENDNHKKHLTNNVKLILPTVSLENEVISQGIVKSQNSELTQNSCDSNAIESSNLIKNSEDIKSEEVCDSNPLKIKSSEEYLYDENYKMYYCTSTGYYYDTNSGLYYVPQNGAYYTYDYTKNAYVLYSVNKSEVDSENNNNKLQVQLHDAETNNSPKQLKEDYICESVVHQVNNLNISDTSDCSSKITDAQDISEENIVKVDEDKLQDENCLLETQDQEDVTVTRDWQPPDGTSLTIQDLVREVAEQNIGMSDYIYDENTRMYYSQSTGYYFDSVRNLLYDPKNGTYYSYDQESSSYNFYYQLDASQISSNKDEKNVDIEIRKRKARKRYWLKKQNENGLQCCEEKSEDNHEIEVQNEDYSSPEEGEVFSSDSEEDVHCHVLSSPKLEKISNVRFPCIRAIVKSSVKLKIGTLILITYTGAIIGNDKVNEVFIPDVDISKVHAEVTFNQETWKYSIKDLGSQNGTFLNNTRLSKPKEESQSHILHHEDNVSIGSCKLLFHIHVGYETCDGCEPGQIMEELRNQPEECIPAFKTNEEKKKEWKKEVRRLKKKYGLEGMDYVDIKNSVSASGSTYEDKADIRRKTVGSENPYEKTEVASMERVMDETNVGYQMLKKLGWKEGEPLGSAGQGISEPIPLQPWLSRAGLGSSHRPPKCTQSAAEDRKRKKWVKAQERFLLLS